MKLSSFIPRIIALALACACGAAPLAASAAVFVNVSVGVAPPPLPVYVQPPCPQPNYLWIPGYWSYGDVGYYWVPGYWAAAPDPGYLWTPGYWGWNAGYYAWHPGYWGQHVGYYGGINYGYGYFGVGFFGGGWYGNSFRYNTAVVNVNRTYVRNVYSDRTYVHNMYIHNTYNTTINRTSFNGGPGGIRYRPSQSERMAMQEQHFGETSVQRQNRMIAAQNRNYYAAVNHGKPSAAAFARPLNAMHRPAHFAPVRAQGSMPAQRPAEATVGTHSFARSSYGRAAGEPAAPRYAHRVTGRSEHTFSQSAIQHTYRQPAIQHSYRSSTSTQFQGSHMSPAHYGTRSGGGYAHSAGQHHGGAPHAGGGHAQHER